MRSLVREWSRGASVLVFGASLVGCDAVLGLGSLKDGPAPEGGPEASVGIESDGGTTTPDDGSVSPDSTILDAGGDAAPDAGGGVADATSPDAAEASSCTNACTAGATRCAGGGVETCKSQPGGCTAWVQTSTCGAHQTCSAGADAGAASCSCTSNLCTQSGTVCQDQQTLTTCSTDTNGCAYVSSTTTCPSPQSCSGAAPSASCSLTCTDSCTSGNTACLSGELALCTKGSNGCWAYGTPAACPSTHQSCTGPSGSASCTCNTDPTCQGASDYCTNSSTLVTCTQDAQTCRYPSATQTCTGGACTGSAGAASCCTNACTAGATQCGASYEIQTCEVQANGCTAWVNTSSCTLQTSGSSCVVFNGAAKCGCNVAADCPTYTACDLSVHTCGTTTSEGLCSPTNLCQQGCCGTVYKVGFGYVSQCQSGFSNTACGNTGAACATCTGSQTCGASKTCQ